MYLVLIRRDRTVEVKHVESVGNTIEKHEDDGSIVHFERTYIEKGLAVYSEYLRRRAGQSHEEAMMESLAAAR